MSPGADRIRFVLRQLGPKAGAKDRLRDLLSADDLPGRGWHRLDERTRRTGLTGTDSGWASRARQTRSVTSWRSFEQKNHQRWMWAQIVPLVSEADVVDAIDGIGAPGLRNLRAEVTVAAGEDLLAPRLPVKGPARAHRQRTTGPIGDGETLYLSFGVGPRLVILACSGFQGGWTWDMAANLARLQIERFGDLRHTDRVHDG